MLKGEKF